MRYERELPRTVDIEGAAYHTDVPPMILLNLVENAVKHGTIDATHPLAVTARVLDGALQVSVRNHGSLGPSPTGRPGGLGIARARLKAIYGDTAKLEIHPSGPDIVAWFEIPSTPPSRLPS
jgi:LytS/YehU family sensor histidine kinase